MHEEPEALERLGPARGHERAVAELLARLRTREVELERSERARYDAALVKWRTLRTERGVSLFAELIESERMSDNPEREAITRELAEDQVKARDSAIEAVRARRAAAKAAAEDLADAVRRGEPPKKDAATLASEERARVENRKAMKDPTNFRRGYDHLEKDLRATEKSVALAKTPEARVAALHRASQLRAAMETARRERERELRRERVVAAMGARKKEGPVEEDERWLA